MTGLEVNGDVGLGQTATQQIHSIWDTYDAMSNWLTNLGFTDTQRPPWPLPSLSEDDYVNIEGDDYGRTCLRVDRWFEYASDLRAQLKGRLMAVRDEMDIIATDYRVEVREQTMSVRGKKPSADELKDNIKRIPRYRELMLYEQNLMIAMERIEAKQESLERFAKGLSRQLTMRGQEIDLTNKGGRRVGIQRG